MNFQNIFFPLIITISLIVIYTLIKTPKNSHKKTKNIKHHKETKNIFKEPTLNSISTPKTNSIITSSLLTKDDIRKLITKIYTKELKISEIKLTLEDEQTIKILTEKLTPLIEKEMSITNTLTKEELIPKYTPHVIEHLNIINKEKKEESKPITPQIEEKEPQLSKSISSKAYTLPKSNSSPLLSKTLQEPVVTISPTKSYLPINNIKPFKFKNIKQKSQTTKTSTFKIKTELPIPIKSSPLIFLTFPTQNQKEPNISNNTQKNNFLISHKIPENSKNRNPLPTDNITKEKEITLKTPISTEEQLKNDLTNIILELEPLTSPKEKTLENLNQFLEKSAPTQDNETSKQPSKIEYQNLNLTPINDNLNDLIKITQNEFHKDEIEDKNYEDLELKAQKIADLIFETTQKNLPPEDIAKLNEKKRELEKIQANIANSKDLDIKKEEELLNETISRNELIKLEEELKNLHLENQLDINEEAINKLEDLEQMNKEQSTKIEKKLMKKKLKRANRAMTLTSILALPFIRNKYFLYFTIGLFVNSHLNFFSHIIKRKTPEFTPPDLSTIKKGEDSLNEALNLTTTNINYLNELEQTALLKYPELINDYEYLSYINNLKTSLLKQEEKMFKKKKALQKYVSKNEAYTRKLKKKY